MTGRTVFSAGKCKVAKSQTKKPREIIKRKISYKNIKIS